MPSQDDVLRVLAALEIPDSRLNLVRDGMISDLSATERDDGLHVQLVLEIAPEDANTMERFRPAAQKAMEAIEGIASARVILTSHKAAPPDPKTACKTAEGASKPETRLPEGVKRVIAVASGKGGVGKSTTAVNLALALSQLGLDVGILDIDVYGPSVPHMLGRMDEIEADEQDKLVPLSVHGIAAMSIGYLVPEDAPLVWRGPMVHSAIKQMLYDVAWGLRDVLILDMPPGTGDAALSVAQQVPLDGAVIVSTPQDVALLDVRKSVAMFQKVGVPILGMIENMSVFECPHCRKCTDIFGKGGAKKDAERLGIPFLGSLPLDIAIRQMADAGTPTVVAAPDSLAAQTYRSIAHKLFK